jgi:hypothetical protein
MKARYASGELQFSVGSNGQKRVAATLIGLTEALPVLKGGTGSEPIRLAAGNHEIDCKLDGMAIALNACCVKKA